MSQTRRSRALLPAAVAAASAALLLGPHLLSFVVGRSSALEPPRARGVVGGRTAGAATSKAAAEAGAALGAAVGEAIGEIVDDVLATPRSEAKAALMDLLEDETIAAEVLKPEGQPTRGRVDEFIKQLERYSPEEEPVYSDLLDGTWAVKYSGTVAPGALSSPTRELALFLYGGGFSLGNAISSFANGFWGQSLGLKVNDLTVRISGEGRNVQSSADVEFLGRTETLTYSAELMPLSAMRMSEEILEVELPEPFGEQLLPLELRRNILVTYLDRDLMVVRHESGTAEVLVRDLIHVPPEEYEFAQPVAGNATSNATLTNATGQA